MIWSTGQITERLRWQEKKEQQNGQVTHGHRAIAYKQIDGKDKFFLYFANDASGIGVLEADTPLGPWKDPIEKPLLTGKTPGCEGVVWCFDPAVLVDDDGSAYIYFGGGVPEGKQNNPKTARVAKLGDDMISIDGAAKEIDAPCMV